MAKQQDVAARRGKSVGQQLGKVPNALHGSRAAVCPGWEQGVAFGRLRFHISKHGVLGERTLSRHAAKEADGGQKEESTDQYIVTPHPRETQHHHNHDGPNKTHAR